MPRLALGLAVLAAERLRHGPVGDGVYLAVGVAGESAEQARRATGAVLAPTRRAAGQARSVLSALPGSRVVGAPLAAARERVAAATRGARLRGAATVGSGRAQALVFLNESVDDGVDWAQREVVPQIVDGLVPHLVATTLPRIIDGALPDIRLRVLPVVVDDLTTDPKIRDLVSEQGRGMLGDAANELRATTATADDRLESAFLRLLRRPPRTPPVAPDLTGAPDPTALLDPGRPIGPGQQLDPDQPVTDELTDPDLPVDAGKPAPRDAVRG